MAYEPACSPPFLPPKAVLLGRMKGTVIPNIDLQGITFMPFIQQQDDVKDWNTILGVGSMFLQAKFPGY